MVPRPTDEAWGPSGHCTARLLPSAQVSLWDSCSPDAPRTSFTATPPPPEQLRPPHICNVAYSLGLMRDSLGTPSLCHAPAECTWRAITCGGRVRRCMSQGFSWLRVSLPQECCCWWQGCLPSRAGWRIDVLSAQVLTRSAAPRWTGFEVVGGECALTCLATPPGHRPGPAASSLS